MSILSVLWAAGRAYQPAATRNRKARRFGAFKPTYAAPAYHRAPRTDREAQRMYNHIRTVAFYLDAAPLLTDMGIPFRAGLDDIISLVPLYGDILSGIVQLYQVFLCWIFGVPMVILGQMLLNVVLDVAVGIVPLIGDILDNLFKANLRNLALLEKWLLHSGSQQYHILLMPDSAVWLPEPKAASVSSASRTFKGWFGLGATSEENEEREAERATGQVKRTRRMDRSDAAYAFRADTPGGANGTTTSAEFAEHAPGGEPRFTELS